MRSSETCQLLAEQMLADAQREPERNELRLRVAHSWLELAKTLKRAEAVNGTDAHVNSTTSQPKSVAAEEEFDGAAFIARLGMR